MLRVFRFVYVSTLCLIAALGFERAWAHEMPPYYVDPDVSTEFRAGAIQFQPCAEGPDMQCGRLTLPVDYRKPHGEVFSMSVIRAPTTKPARRIGVLLHSPGEPGRLGITSVIEAAPTPTLARLRERFDVVSFDARNVGLSSTNLARDVDVLRGALGEEQVTFLGRAYGSRVGAVYASLFPERVRAMVLDGSSTWPEEDTPVIRDVSGRLEHPILIIGTELDNAAPRGWSSNLAHALGMEHSLIRYEGGGLTAFPAANSICIDLAVEGYLFDLAVPAAGTRCPAQPIHF